MFVKANDLKAIEHRWGSNLYKKYGKAYILVTEQDYKNYVSTGKPMRNFGATFIIKDNKPQYIFGDILFGECSVVEGERKESLLDTMAEHNLKLSEKNNHRVDFIDHEKMMFSINGKLYTADEARHWELKPGLAFEYFHDNGYSFIGTSPAKSPQAFVDSAIRYVKEKGYFSPILICGFDFKKDFTCYVRIGKNESWSEVSNT